jgi:hypothetical protein
LKYLPISHPQSGQLSTSHQGKYDTRFFVSTGFPNQFQHALCDNAGMRTCYGGFLCHQWDWMTDLDFDAD